MLKKNIVLLFGGRAGTGKTTSCQYLFRKIHSDTNLLAEVTNFAGTLKEVAREYFYWDGNKDDRGRRLLQDLGRVGRNYFPEIWAAHCFEKYENALFNPDFILIDDWRFVNEGNYGADKYNWVKFYKIYIKAPNREILKGTFAYDDISEIELANKEDSYFDYLIDNRGTIDHLYYQLDEILNDIILKNLFK